MPAAYGCVRPRSTWLAALALAGCLTGPSASAGQTASPSVGMPCRISQKMRFGEPQALTRQFALEPDCLGCGVPAQEIGPDGRVDDHHDRSTLNRTGRPAGLEVAFPTNATTQLADTRLRPRLHEQLQRLIDHPSLRRASARAQRLPHQAIVDVDVRAHLTSMCNCRRIACIRQRPAADGSTFTVPERTCTDVRAIWSTAG
jgi:hypothetical protein